MLSSVKSIDSTGLASNRGVSRFPGLRAAAVLAAIGSMTLAAAGQDSYDGANSADFNDALNWVGGVYPGDPGDDFGGGIIDILSVFGAAPINVADGISGIGGLTNTFGGAVIFRGTGSFTFSDLATINPNAGSFTFDIDVIADGSLTFDLTGGGAVQIDGSFTTNGGTILADGGVVEINGVTTSATGTTWNANDGGFSFNADFNGAGDQTFGGTNAVVSMNGGIFTVDGLTTSGEGMSWEANDGSFNFDGGFAGTGDQSFTGTSGTVADDTFVFGGDTTFFATGDPLDSTATFTAATVSSTGQVTVGDGYNFTLADASSVLFNDFIAQGAHAITFADDASTFQVRGVAEFADGGSLTVTGEGDANFAGDATFLGDFTADFGDANASITFADTLSFLADKSLTVTGDGTLNVSGRSTFDGAFSLLVDDAATVEWSGAFNLVDTFVIDTTGVGNATVNFSGAIRNAGGVDDVTIEITTDGNDTVKFSSIALVDLDGTVQVNANSSVTFEPKTGPVPVPVPVNNSALDLVLRDGATANLGSAVEPGIFNFNELNDWVDPVDSLITETGTVTQTGIEDATLAVQGGTFSGVITDELADLSLLVSTGEFNYSGAADFGGSTTVDNGGTLNLTGSIDGTENLVLTNGTLEIGAGGSMIGSGRVTVDGESTFNLVAGDVATTDNASFDFTASNDERMSIEGSVSLSSTGEGVASLNYGSNAVVNGSLTAADNSTVDMSGDLTVGRQGQLLLEDTAIAEVGGDLALDGLIDLSGTSVDGLTVTGGATLSGGSTIQAAGNRTLTINGDTTMAAGAGLLLEEDSVATFNSELDLAATAGGTQAATVSLTGDSTLTVTGAVTGDGNLTLSGAAMADLNGDAAFAVIQAQDTSSVDVQGNLDLTGNSVFEGGTTLTVGGMLDLADGAMLDLQGTDLDAMNLTATGGIMVNSGATLMANANVDTSELTYAGTLEVGVNGDSSGVLNLNTGDLVSDGSDAILNINLTGEYVNDLAAGTYGQTSVINVASGNADFSDSGSNRLFVNIVDAAYIPDDKDITLLQTSSNRVGNAVVTTSQDESITRTWTIDQMDPLSIMAHSAADYAAPLEGTTDYLRGVELNSLRPVANLNPTGDAGILLGQFDALDSLAAYEAAIEGVGPTTQVSTIQLAASTQYFNVLRKEIRRRYSTVKQRTPAPFRLSNGTEYASSQDDAVQAKIRRNIRQPATAEGFGVFWGRSLDTPTEGDIIGISGNEYGGLGGFAWQLGSDFVGGVNLGYSQISGDLDGGFGNTRVGTVRGGGFVSWANENGLFFDVAAAGAWNHYKFSRVIPNTQLSADSDADGFQLDLSLGGGYRIELDESWAITPEASFMYSYVNTGNIDEDSSSAAALSISPGDLSSVIGRVGGGLSWSALPGLVVDAELGWQGNFNFNGSYDVSLANQGTKLNIAVDNQTINTAYYGLGVNWTPTYNVNVSLQYEGRNGEGLNSNMFYGGVSIGF